MATKVKENLRECSRLKVGREIKPDAVLHPAASAVNDFAGIWVSPGYREGRFSPLPRGWREGGFLLYRKCTQTV